MMVLIYTIICNRVNSQTSQPIIIANGFRVFFLSKYTAWYDFRIPSHQMVFHKPTIGFKMLYIHVDYLYAYVLLGSMHRVYSVYIPRKSHMYTVDEDKDYGCLFGYRAVTTWAKLKEMERMLGVELDLPSC
jgi:hypothetical protein